MKSIILAENKVQEILENGKIKLHMKKAHPLDIIFYVKETWQSFFPDRVAASHQRGPQSFGVPHENTKGNYKYFYYRADGELPDHPKYGVAHWRSAREMPFKAARIFLKVRKIKQDTIELERITINK